MHDMSRMTHQKTWQRRRRPVSVLAEMALRREKVTERLEKLREAHSLTQEQAAARVGITHRQWQRWESGESMPYPRSFDAIAHAFGIPVSEFFDDQPAAAPGQLDRIEALLTATLARLDALEARVLDTQAEDAAELLDADILDPLTDAAADHRRTPARAGQPSEPKATKAARPRRPPREESR